MWKVWRQVRDLRLLRAALHPRQVMIMIVMMIMIVIMMMSGSATSATTAATRSVQTWSLRQFSEPPKYLVHQLHQAIIQGKYAFWAEKSWKESQCFFYFLLKHFRTEKPANMSLSMLTMSCTLEVFSPLMTSWIRHQTDACPATGAKERRFKNICKFFLWQELEFMCHVCQGRCVICGGPGISDAYYCKECTIQVDSDNDHDKDSDHDISGEGPWRLPQDCQPGQLKNWFVLWNEKVRFQKKMRLASGGLLIISGSDVTFFTCGIFSIVFQKVNDFRSRWWLEWRLTLSSPC